MTAPLFVIYHDLKIGGIQRKIVDIINHLSLVSPSQTVYLLLRCRKKEDSILLSQLKNKKVKIIYYSEWLRLKIPFFFLVFIFYHVWKLKPGAILAFLTLPGISAVWSKLVFFWRKIRVVISEEPNKRVSEEISSYRYAFFYHWLIKAFYPFADKVITVNSVFRMDLIKNYCLSPEKVKLVANWTIFSGKKMTGGKKKYDLVFIGRLIKAKRVVLLLKALKKIRKIRPKTTLCLVGSGNEEGSLKNWAKKQKITDGLFFAGKTDDVEKYLSSSKMLIIPSATEGMPIAALEANALGVPVISFNYPGVGDLIKEGINGYVFSSVTQLTDKILFLLSNPKKRRALSALSRKYSSEHHSPDKINFYLNELGI